MFISSFDVGVQEILSAFLNFPLIFIMNAYFFRIRKKRLITVLFEREKYQAQFKILYKPLSYTTEEHLYEMTKLAIHVTLTNTCLSPHNLSAHNGLMIYLQTGRRENQRASVL